MSSKQSKLSQLNLCRGILVVVSVIAFIVWLICKNGNAVSMHTNNISSPDTAQQPFSLLPQQTNIKGAEVLPLKEFHIKNIDTDYMEKVNTIYVIPGGGSSDDDGYPEWTKRRVIAAVDHYEKGTNKDSSLFIALSAGSFNTRNVLQDDGRIMFECEHMINHLVGKGIPKSIVFGDIFSWDSVTNAHSLRMFLEGVLLYKQLDDTVINKKTTTKLQVEVFISDFHAERIKEAFNFLLGLQPSILGQVQLSVNVVGSAGIKWKSEEDFRLRVKHEDASIARLKETALQIKTMAHFHAFIMLGGHQGVQKYVHNEYVKSSGGGW